MDARRIGRPQNGAQVARFFNGFRNDHKRMLGQLQIAEFARELGSNDQQPIGAFAIGDLFEHGCRAGENFGAEVAALLHNHGLVDVFEVQLFAEKKHVRAIPVFERPFTLAISFDQHLTGFIAVGALTQFDSVLNFRICKRSNT